MDGGILLAIALCTMAAAAAGAPSRTSQAVLRREITSARRDAFPVSLLEIQADGTQISVAKAESSAGTAGSLLQTLAVNSEIQAVAFSPKGLEVATGSAENAVTVWSAGTGIALRTLYHHKGKVHSINYSPDGEMILTGGTDKALIWGSKSAVIEVEFNQTGSVNEVAFSRDCMHIITAADNKIAKVWDTRNLHLKCQLIGHIKAIGSVAMNPDGGTAITGSHDFTAKIWDVEACIAQAGQQGKTDVKEAKVTMTGHTGPVSAVAYSPHGTWVVTGSEDFTARIWSATNGTSLRIFGQTGGGHMGGVNSIAWKPRQHGAGIASKPNQDLVVTGSDDGTAKVWYAHSGLLMKTFNHGGKVTSVAWGPDGDRILTGSTDGTAKIWTLDNSMMGTLMRGYLISAAEPTVPMVT